MTSRVVEWNDPEALEAALAEGDVAAVLGEPVMTNIGIILPDPGCLDFLRDCTRRHWGLPDPDRFMHLWALNRGILMTPFHNMAMVSPDLTEADIDHHMSVFRSAVEALLGRSPIQEA